jgi:hypothetical protein
MLNLKIKLNMEQKTQLQESCLAFAKHLLADGTVYLVQILN